MSRTESVRRSERRRRANENLPDREGNESRNGKAGGCASGEGVDWLVLLGIQYVIQSKNEDRKEVTEEWRRTMRHDFVKGVKYKFVSCKNNRK